MDRLDDQPAARRALFAPAMVVQGIALLAVLGVHYRHVLERLAYIWRHDGDWSHGFIIPLFSVYYLYLQRHRLPRGLPAGGWIPRLAGAVLMTAAFLLYVRSTLLRQAYPKDISLVLTIMGMVLMVCGWPLARWSWFAIAFLLFAMPLPQRLYQELTMPLREVAATVSAATLSALPGMSAEAQGTVVEYVSATQGRSGTLDVEQACSGMRLLVTMSALGVAMAFLNDRQLWQRMVVILACVPIAVFCNIVRVTTTGFLIVFGQQELASGVPHMLLGLGMLLIAFALYGGISYVLTHLFEEAEADAQGQTLLAGGVGT